jgi:hypothetical protein
MIGPHVWRRRTNARARLSFNTLNSADFARVTPGMPQLQHVAATKRRFLLFVITIFRRVITGSCTSLPRRRRTGTRRQPLA